jgi:hypothetical protein
MQEFADTDPNVALNQTQSFDRSVAPAVSEYCNPNIWIDPLPDAGITESAVTVVVLATAAIVHVPLVCQPLLMPEPLDANIWMLVGPLKAALNATARFSVSVVPLSTALLAASPITH